MNTLADKITENVANLDDFYFDKGMHSVTRVLDLIQGEVDELAKKNLSDEEFFVEFEKALEELYATYGFVDTELEIWEDFMDDTQNKQF